MAAEACAIGVDIGGTKTAVTAWTLQGKLLAKRRFATEGNSAEVIEKIGEAIDATLSESGVELSAVAGIGVSCGGPLDSSLGLVLSPPNLPSWDSVPIAGILAKKTGRPCYLENDANACALAEWYWGAGRGCQSMVFLTFGTGLGAGLILDGRLYRGACDLAGEVGHLRIAEDGPLGYGKRGSWEGYCSGGGIARLYEERCGERRTTQEICEAAKAGQARALAVIDESAFQLGRGLSLLIDLLNPERIVIGSVFARSGELFREKMEEVIEKEALEAARKRCAVVPAELGELLGDMAALGIVIDRSGARIPAP